MVHTHTPTHGQARGGCARIRTSAQCVCKLNRVSKSTVHAWEAQHSGSNTVGSSTGAKIPHSCRHGCNRGREKKKATTLVQAHVSTGHTHSGRPDKACSLTACSAPPVSHPHVPEISTTSRTKLWLMYSGSSPHTCVAQWNAHCAWATCTVASTGNSHPSMTLNRWVELIGRDRFGRLPPPPRSNGLVGARHYARGLQARRAGRLPARRTHCLGMGAPTQGAPPLRLPSHTHTWRIYNNRQHMYTACTGERRADWLWTLLWTICCFR